MQETPSASELLTFAELKNIVLLFLLLVALFLPEEVNAQDEVDNSELVPLVCSLLSQEEEEFLDPAYQLILSCEDGTEVELLVFLYELAIQHMTPSQKPSESFKYVERIMDPNYNCHAYAMQQIEEKLGFSLQQGTTYWLERGLIDFLNRFGREIATSEIPEREEDFEIDLSEVNFSDDAVYVVVYLNEQGQHIHTGVLVDNEGVVAVRSKLGRAELTEASIFRTGWRYEADLIEGDRVVIYKVQRNNLPRISNVASRPVYDQQPTTPEAKTRLADMLLEK